MTREDRLRRQHEDESNSILWKAAKAAFLIGAGTTVLHRAGLMPKIAKNFDTLHDFMSSAKKEWLPKKNFDEITISDVKKSLGDAKEFYHKAKNDYETKPIRLDLNSNSSLLGVLQARETFKNASGAVTEKVWRRNTLIDEAHIFLNQNFSDVSKSSYEKWKKFVEKAAKNIDNSQHIHDTFNSIDFTDEEKNMALQTLQAMKNKSATITEDVKRDEKKSVQDKINQAFDAFMDVENLERVQGTARDNSANFFKDLLKYQAVTIGDLLDKKNASKFATDFIEVNKRGRPEKEDPIKILRDMYDKLKEKDAQKAERFLDVYVDRERLRKDEFGNFYTFSTTDRIEDELLNMFAGSLPGTLMKLRAIQHARKAPVFQFIERGTIDPIFAARTGAPNNSHEVQDNFVRINKNFYKLTASGVEEIQGLDDLYFVSGRFSASSRLTRQMTGDADTALSDNIFMRYFDIGQDRTVYDGQNIFDRITGIFQKQNDPNWRGNILNRMLNPTEEQRTEFDFSIVSKKLNYAHDYLNKAERLNNFFERNTYGFDYNIVNFLYENTSGKAQELLSIITESDDKKMLRSFLDYSESHVTVNSGYHNLKLQDLLQKYVSNPKETLTSFKLLTDRTHLNLSSQLSEILNTKPSNESADFFDILRTEIGKEAVLQYAQDSAPELAREKNYKAVLDLFENLAESNEKIHAKRLAQLAIFQDKTAINSLSKKNISDEELFDIMNRFEEVLNLSQNKVEDDAIRETLKQMRTEGISDLESFSELHKESDGVMPYNKWIAVGKTATPLDLIKNLNNQTKSEAIFKKMFWQFNAGASDPENITTLTYAPYFMLSRLSDAMNAVGLGFSAESMGSTFDIAKNIMLKRVLPVTLASNYFEYLDDTSQDITGTSITGAFSQGLMNVDLSARRTLDAFGITDWLKEMKQINPIMQYWGDRNEFMSYDERKKWYESGYEPVRKGAWWIFGSVNEARGGEIQYWQPSFVRRINSDYKDISLYGSNDEKWAHSWLPTPTHPLSPLRALINPYWLEEMNEEDRPYAISGSLFADGTPWGAILNPTIGEFIKPREELHPYRLRNGVDIKNVIREANEYIRAKARDLTDNNLISLKGSDLTAQGFVNWNAPSEDTSFNSYQTGINVYDSRNVLQSSSGYGSNGVLSNFYSNGSRHEVYGIYSPSPISYSEGFNPLDSENVQYLYDNERFSTAVDWIKSSFGIGEDNLNPMPDEIKIHDKDIVADKNGKFGVFRVTNNDYEAIQDAKDMLRDMNEAIKKKPQKFAHLNDFDKDEGIISPEKLKDYRPSKGMELLNHPDEIAEMVNQGSAYDFVHNVAISERLVTGIYGYMLGSTTGIGVDNQKMIPTSQDMTSFSRNFWDSNIGGAGGDVMEIVRRFIPDFRRGNRISPLLNNMPDWLPERFKFGDPYTILPKGEARLPGAGYESLNKLHPDVFGYYGAFDRFKILADIAPFSPEYKIWREVAKKTVIDPDLIEEMEEIRQRVTEQGKKHDFYEYQFRDRGIKYDTVIISEILDHGKFKSGDDKIFKLAGVKVRGNDFETATEVMNRYLHVGQEVTVAVDENESYGKNRDTDRTINAAVFLDGENISKMMLENGDATKRKSDTSAAAYLANYSPLQKFIGSTSEFIAHLDVPWLSDQFLRVRSPLEAYRADEVYGTPYQSWEHPIDSFLYPAVERSIYENQGIWKPLFTYAYKTAEKIPGIDALDKKFLAGAYLLSNRGAFIGAALSNLIFIGDGTKAMKAAKISGSLIDLVSVWKGGHSYADQIFYSAMIGDEVARFFEKNRKKGAIIGAAVGSLIRTIRGGVNYDYTPDRTTKKWQTQEYFDRLTHLKYIGLYHAAAEKAKEEEGVDLEEEIEKREWIKNRKDELSDQLDALSKSVRKNMRDSEFRRKILSAINARNKNLKDHNTIIRGGKYTHSALLYKQAAEQTMTGLKENATWSQIISALPKNDREYFTEFVKERDPDKRNEILRMVSPFLGRALNLAWGNGLQEEISDEEYFENEKIPLPDAKWKGWRPDVNLSDVEVKTIENEGMLLSDFGYYESELRKDSVIYSPTVFDSEPVHNVRRCIHKRLSKVCK